MTVARGDSGVQPRIWIGLGHVTPIGDGPILSASDRGAYVHLLILALDEGTAKEQATVALRAEKLELSSLEDLETLDDRRRWGHVSEELLESSHGLSIDEPVVFGTFHIYEEE